MGNVASNSATLLQFNWMSRDAEPVCNGRTPIAVSVVSSSA